MATTQAEFDAGLKALIAAEAARDAAVTSSLNDLIAKVAAGEPIADLSAELASIQALQSNAAAITAQATADDPGPTDVTAPPASGSAAAS